jgi:hypothetical protein
MNCLVRPGCTDDRRRGSAGSVAFVGCGGDDGESIKTGAGEAQFGGDFASWVQPFSIPDEAKLDYGTLEKGGYRSALITVAKPLEAVKLFITAT